MLWMVFAHLAKASHWELTWLDESLRGSAAISTTASGKLCCRRRSQIRATRLDPKGEGLCGTKGGEGWGCTGTGLRLAAGREDEGWAEVAETGVVKRWGSLLCLGNSWSFGGFGGLLELVGRHKLGLSRPRIWRTRLPPMLCRLGKVKHKLVSSCSPRWRTCPLEGSLRQRTDCVRLPREAATPSGWDCWDETRHPLSHSTLREGGWEWEESQTDPEVK